MYTLRPLLNFFTDHLRRRWHLHAILWPATIAVGLTLAYTAGVLTSPTTQSYFRSHFRASLPVPAAHQALPPIAHALPSLGGITISRYPAVGDQDGQGSCAAWATAWALSYTWRILHPTSSLRFSPRQMYDHYSDTYNAGNDAGSWPDPDAEISSTTGLLQFKALPEPPYQIDNPIPTYDAWGHLTSADAAKHTFPVTFTHIQGFASGGGQGLVDAIKAAIDSNHPALVAFPVYPEYDNATAQPNIVPPSSTESNRGAHMNAAIAYDDTRPMPDGTRGAIEVQNQWTQAWGIQGRAWLSYSFVRSLIFGTEYGTINPTTAAPRPTPTPISPFQPNPAPVHPPPPTTPTPNPPPTVTIPRAATTQAWYVQHVPGYTYANGRTVYTQDLAPLINAWGDRYHISPIGITGTLLTESGGTINAERWAGGLDNSCGLLQQIITNVQAYTGITGARAQCAWEENPNNSIYLGTRMLKECSDQHGGRIPFAYLDVGYNAGCSWPDWYFFNPTASDVRAHLAAYIGNYNYALTHYAGPPPRPTFGRTQARVWSQYRKERHLSFIPHTGYFPWQWHQANWKAAGGIVQHETWNPRRHLMTERLQGYFAFWWPHHPAWHVTWKRTPWLR